MILKYRAEVDGLRAIAVIAVVLFHAYPLSLPGGLIGVDIFFVISGYLITGILLKNSGFTIANLLHFYVRRVLRIFPALILTLVTTYAFGWMALYADDLKELGLHIASGAAFISNFTYLSEFGYFDTNAALKPLLHLWSLAVEEQFYLIWPLLVFLISRNKHPQLLVLLLLFASFSLNIYYSMVDIQQAYFLPFTRFWELFAGAYLAFEERRDLGGLVTGDAQIAGVTGVVGIVDIANANANADANVKINAGQKNWAIGGIVLILLSFFFVDGEVNFPGWQAIFPVVGAYYILKYARIGWAQKILSQPLLVGIGLISYPLYLYHWPLFSFARITAINPSNLTMVVLILVAFLLAWLTYQLIEKPIRKSGPRLTLGLILVMAIIGGVGYSAYVRDGLDFRQVRYEIYKKELVEKLFSGIKADPISSSDRFLEPSKEYDRMLNQLVVQLKTSNVFRREEKEKFKEINQASYFCSGVDCQKGEKQQRLIVIVGDSHAANFYSALSLTHPQIAFKQFSASGCTPIASRYKNADNRCKLMLDQAYEFVQNNPVDLVMLAARWQDYFSPILEDVQRFQSYAPKVAIVGPSVIFSQDVEKFLTRYDGQQPIQAYVNSFVEVDKLVLNDQMKAFASTNGIGYIDKIKVFCGEGFCRLTETGNELFVHDRGHVSLSGALFLGNHLKENNTIRDLLK